MDQIIDWLYGKLIGFFAEFFSLIGNMGVELFELEWVQSIILFFSYLAWALFVVAIIVSLFEKAIDYQSGKGELKELGLNLIKGFFAVSLFAELPIQLYALSVKLQHTLTIGITGSDVSFGEMATEVMNSMPISTTASDAISFGGISSITTPLFSLFLVFMIGYAIMTVFFSNITRGGILLVQICLGSLYIFSLVRGYDNGFIGWCKSVIGICLTAFLQVTILTAGLMMLKDNALLGLGLMLSSKEIPRIAGNFGIETSAKVNVMGAVQSAMFAMSMTRNLNVVK